jgi:acetyltransferase-like isoleucine patch superfamily enzyme
MIQKCLNTPWKVQNEIYSWLSYPWVRLLFAFYRVPWGKGWCFHGIPIIQKHRESIMVFGPNMQLRSRVRSNPLGANHPVILCTWEEGARLQIGSHFCMTGGAICAAEKIIVGDYVTIGANCTVIDTDFHPLNPERRIIEPHNGKSAPIIINDHVFIGMNCLILKGIEIGQGSVVGAGSVVSKNIPKQVIAAGNPALKIKDLP